MISVARLQTYLGVGADQAAYLAQLEAAAVQDLQTLTGRYLGAPKSFQDIRDVRAEPARLTRPENGFRPQSIRLSQPVPSVAALTVSQRYSPRDAWVEIDAETTDTPPRPVFELEGHRLYRVSGSWPSGARVVRAVYQFGYAADAAPANFEAVAFDLVSSRYAEPALRRIPSRVTGASVRGANLTLRSDGGGSGIPADLMERILALRAAGSF